MDAVEFIREEIRMCASYQDCTECPLCNTVYCSVSPKKRTKEEAEEIVLRVMKWAEEHRPKTRQEKFLEQFPKAKVFADGILNLCPENLEGTCQYKTNTQDTGYHCDKCRKEYWMKEVE